MSRSQKNKTWPKSKILAHFKGICAEFVKFIFTMLFNVHMRLFCLVFYMKNFLNCIQSGGQGHRKKKSCSKCFKTYFILVSKVILAHTLLQ